MKNTAKQLFLKIKKNIVVFFNLFSSGVTPDIDHTPTNESFETQTAFVSEKSALIFNLNPPESSYNTQINYFGYPIIKSLNSLDEKNEKKEEIKAITAKLTSMLGTQNGTVYSEQDEYAKNELDRLERFLLKKIEVIKIQSDINSIGG